MTVYVAHYRAILFSDEPDSRELRAIAAKVRIPAARFDTNHYDITVEEELKAIAAGACPLSPRATDEIFTRQQRASKRKSR